MQPRRSDRSDKVDCMHESPEGSMIVGTTDNNSMARKVVFEIVIVVLHLDIVLKYFEANRKPETSKLFSCYFPWWREKERMKILNICKVPSKGLHQKII